MTDPMNRELQARQLANDIMNAARALAASHLRECLAQADNRITLASSTTSEDALRESVEALAMLASESPESARPAPAVELLTIWREICERSPGWLGMPLKAKGLRFEEADLVRIGSAIEALAGGAKPERISAHAQTIEGADELPLAPGCTPCAADGPGSRCCGTGECMLCPLSATECAEDALVLSFQSRVAPWMLECFGADVSRDRDERSHRFLEEALELVQAAGCSSSEAHQLVDYVFGRPAGEILQEVGGLMVTLAALCVAQDVDMHAAGETELARVWTKIDVIRAKHAMKPKHSPLPGVSAALAFDETAERAAFSAEENRRGWQPGDFMLGAYAGWLAARITTADNWRRYATERETTAQEVIERHRGESDALLTLLAEARRRAATPNRPAWTRAMNAALAYRNCDPDASDEQDVWVALTDAISALLVPAMGGFIGGAEASPNLKTCSCRWNGEELVQQCARHQAWRDAISEWAERAKAAEAKLAATVQVADWSNRSVDSFEGWINELLTLREHHDLQRLPVFARDAMRTIAQGLLHHMPTATEPALPLMHAAFRTTETMGNPEQIYRMIFDFPSMADLHAADAEWLTMMDPRRTRATVGHTAEPIRLLAPQPSPARDIVPGKVHCAKCGFTLQRVNLYMLSGTTGVGGEETEPCPNDGTPMLPITWEQEAREAWKMAEQQFDRAHALQAALAELVACKDLKDKITGADVGEPDDAAFEAARDDYARRKPRSWAAARALLPKAAEKGSDHD